MGDLPRGPVLWVDPGGIPSPGPDRVLLSPTPVTHPSTHPPRPPSPYSGRANTVPDPDGPGPDLYKVGWVLGSE